MEREKKFEDMEEAARHWYLPNSVLMEATRRMTPNGTLLNLLVRHGLNHNTESKAAGEEPVWYFLSGDVGGGANLVDIGPDGCPTRTLTADGYANWLLYAGRDVLVDYTALPISERATPTGPFFADVDAKLWSYMSLTREYDGVLMLSDVGILVCRTIWEVVREFYPSFTQVQAAKYLHFVVAAKRPTKRYPLHTVTDADVQLDIHRLAQDIAAHREEEKEEEGGIDAGGTDEEEENPDYVSLARVLLPTRSKEESPTTKALEEHERNERRAAWSAIPEDVQDKFREYMGSELQEMCSGKSTDGSPTKKGGGGGSSRPKGASPGDAGPWLCDTGLHVVFQDLHVTRIQGAWIGTAINARLKTVLAPYRARSDGIMTDFGSLVDVGAWWNGNLRMLFCPKCAPCKVCRSLERDLEAGQGQVSAAAKKGGTRGWRNAAEKRRISLCGLPNCVMQKVFSSSVYIPVMAFMIKSGHLRIDIMRMAVMKGMDEVVTVRERTEKMPHAKEAPMIMTQMNTTMRGVPRIRRGSLLYTDLCALIASREGYTHSAECETDPMYPVLIRTWVNLMLFSIRADGKDGKGVPPTDGFVPPSTASPPAYLATVSGGPADGKVVVSARKRAALEDHLLQRVCGNKGWKELEDPDVRVCAQNLVQMYECPNMVRAGVVDKPYISATVSHVYMNTEFPFLRVAIAESDCTNCPLPGHQCGPTVYFNIALYKGFILQHCTCGDRAKGASRIYGITCRELRKVKSPTKFGALTFGFRISKDKPLAQRRLHELSSLVQKHANWTDSARGSGSLRGGTRGTAASVWTQVSHDAGSVDELDLEQEDLVQQLEHAELMAGFDETAAEQAEETVKQLHQTMRDRQEIEIIQDQFGMEGLRVFAQKPEDDSSVDAQLRVTMLKYLNKWSKGVADAPVPAPVPASAAEDSGKREPAVTDVKVSVGSKRKIGGRTGARGGGMSARLRKKKKK